MKGFRDRHLEINITTQTADFDILAKGDHLQLKLLTF